MHQATAENIIWTLPTRKQAYIAAATAKVLSHYSDDEVYLPNIPSWLFGEHEVTEIYEKFKKDLRDVENEIVERNKTLQIPYTVLQPSKIPAGIAI